MLTRASVIQLIAAAAMAYLASALLYFAWQVPDFNSSLDRASATIDRINQNIAPQVPAFIASMDGIQQQIPSILDEVAAVRDSANKILAESDRYASQIPPLLERIDNVKNQVAALQQELPRVYQYLDNLNAAATDWQQESRLWQQESQRWQPTIDQATTELALIRESLPATLDRVDGVLAEAKNLGSEASSGMVTGLVKGVITLPAAVLGGLGTGLTGSRQQEAEAEGQLQVLGQQAYTLLNDKNRNSIDWQNPDIGSSGTITKKKAKSKRGAPCYQLTFATRIEGEQRQVRQTFCQSQNGEWKVQ